MKLRLAVFTQYNSLEIHPGGCTYQQFPWLRIYLPMQGTQVRSLVQEDPTCHGATKPISHNY